MTDPMYFRYRVKHGRKSVEVVNGTFEEAGMAVWRFLPGAEGMFTYIRWKPGVMDPEVERFPTYEDAADFREYFIRIRYHVTQIYRMY